ncbi:FmdB family zinc ribbon protein [Microbacterium sp. MM2322]|uniref:FmdB family zinc ribbon protein n=1 Tax=Microbacterium sp. MM2322 TaxID=3157631 RepID=UPI0032D5A2BA
MPTYAYACTACGHRFDAVQSFSDSALTECPECGGLLRKQYGSIGVTFNGSGFYRTDSRPSSGSASSGESSSSSTSSKSSEASASPASAGS